MVDEASVRALELRARLEPRRKGIATGILVAGVLAGLFISLTAAPPEPSPLDPWQDSKRDLREIEVYGGTANVIATELREWFDGLWQGRTLGLTVAVLSGALALVVFIALTPLPPSPEGSRETSGERKPGS